MNAVVLGMSADPVSALVSFKIRQRLNFSLLSDVDHKIIGEYGAWRMKKFMGRSFKGIVRMTVLIGADGKIEEIWEQVKAKGHAAEVLTRLIA
jgi:thioredoxin-dependent peroxiredoxin